MITSDKCYLNVEKKTGYKRRKRDWEDLKIIAHQKLVVKYYLHLISNHIFKNKTK